MSTTTGIEWTDATWNPVTGCDEVSPGCDHCYAKTFAERWRGTEGHYFKNGFDVQLRPDKLTLPLTWRKPKKVFVNSMSDLFHKDVPDEYIARVFAVMALAPQHTYQILTKRHGRMRSLLSSDQRWRELLYEALSWAAGIDLPIPAERFTEARKWVYGSGIWPETVRPLPSVWLGVSVEDQQRADLRIPALLETPAAVRFLSCEPLLGPVNLFGVRNGLDWVIVGGESGHGARPMAPAWARSLRDQCVDAGVPFLFKQWGAWSPTGATGMGDPKPNRLFVGPSVDEFGVTGEEIVRTSKHAAGRELDGRTWDEYPAVSA